MTTANLARVLEAVKALTPYRNRKRTEVKGKPPSETIIEERR